MEDVWCAGNLGGCECEEGEDRDQDAGKSSIDHLDWLISSWLVGGIVIMCAKFRVFASWKGSVWDVDFIYPKKTVKEK